VKATAATSNPTRVRRPEILVAPVVTAAVICLILVVARYYDRMPIRAAECSFRSLTGIPCVGCGGTRATRALSHGRLVEAIRFNPGVVLLFGASFAWLGWRWWRRRRRDDDGHHGRREACLRVLGHARSLSARFRLASSQARVALLPARARRSCGG